jgi:hypothetical protein
MKIEDYDNSDDAMAAASKMEMRGDWTASINLYRHAAQRWPEHSEYIQQCIDGVSEKQALIQTSQDSSRRPREPTQKEHARDNAISPRRGIRGSVLGALILLAWDVGLTGSFLASFLVCPVWFVVAVLKNAIERPGWGLALLRIAIPPLILAMVMANDVFQRKIAKANAPRVVTACEEFHAANGKYPETLEELVPQYMPSVPRAKYSLGFGEFVYWNFNDSPMLIWYVVPPYSRAFYNFKEGRWRYLD